MMTIEITVPPHHKPGAKLMCRMPNGAAHTVLVPPNAAPGARLRFKVKRPQGMPLPKPA